MESSSTTIIQLVPFRLITPDGVGDYATLLADCLESNHRTNTIFLQGRSATGLEREDKWTTLSVTKRTAGALAASLAMICKERNATVVIVHYSPYGFNQKGVPLWLPRGLARARRSCASIRILTIFHELWPLDVRGLLSTARLLRPVSRDIIRSLVRLSDSVITTNARYKDTLLMEAGAQSDRLDVMQMMSTIGEPIEAGGRRASVAVAFGDFTRAGDEERTAIRTFVRVNEIKSVIVASKTKASEEVFAGCGARLSFYLSPAAEAVSGMLLKSRFGFLPYSNYSVLAKSTVFAAYAAHGVIPVALSPCGPPSDGLAEGMNYISVKRITEADVCKIRLENSIWYSSHNIRALGALVARRIRP